MAKNTLKRLLGLVLSTVLVTSVLSGCGNEVKESSEKPDTTSETTVVSSEVSSEVTEEFSYPMDTDEALTCWVELNGNVAKAATSLNDTKLATALQEATGIEIEFIHPPSGQAKDQLGILIGSGELPDIIGYKWVNYTGGVNAVLGDTIVDLTEAIDKWAPNLKKYLEEHPEIDRMVKTDDGRYYCFPFVQDQDKLLTFQGIIVREDWLNKINMDVPETIDDWYQVLSAFKNELGVDTPLVPLSLHYNNGFLGAWGITNSFYVDAGEVKYGPYETAYKDALETFAQWHAEGLFGNEFATMDSATMKTKILNSEVGAFVGSIGGNMGSYIPALQELDPNANLVAAPSAVLNEGDTPEFGQKGAYFTGSGYTITTSCKNLELAVRFLDYGYSDEGHMLYNFGIEGESYEMVNDYPTYTDEIMNNSQGLAVGAAMAQYTMAPYQGPFVHDVRYIEQYYTMPQQVEALEVFSATNMKEHLLPTLSFTTDETNELAEITNNITTHVDEMTLKYIMGMKDFANYESEYTAVLEKYGVERLLEIYNAAYQRYLAK